MTDTIPPFNNIIHTDRIPGRTIVSDDYNEYLFFSGTSYLAINSNPEFLDMLNEGMNRYGTNYSNSRNGNLQLKIFSEAENYLAQYTGAESAITVSSGYLAAQLAVRALEGSATFIYAPDTHPALWIQPQKHSDKEFAIWVDELFETISGSSETHFVIVCNSLDPLHSVKYDFSWVKRLPSNKSITLVIDDSHGMGITGPEGSGIHKTIDRDASVNLIVVSSFGKALGIPGGIILSDAITREVLRRSSFFSASSPVIPAYLYAFMQSIHIYEDARNRLFNNIREFSEEISSLNLFSSFKDYPVFYTKQNKLYEHLLNHRILISSFAYPTPEDDLITRVVLNSKHTETDLRHLVDSLKEFNPEH